jgi:TonB family protein
MTLVLPGFRLPAAFAASLALHTALAAALAALAGGWQTAASRPPVRGDALFATLRVAQPAGTSTRPAATAPRNTSGNPGGSGPVALLPKPYYYRASELTEPPLMLAAIEPRFPSDAPDTGRVKMRLYISERGSVDAIDVTEAEPAGEFEQAARQAFAEARFRPGYKNGTAVRSQIALEVRFGEPLPALERSPEQSARYLPDNPNAYDAPDRVGIKTRRPL